MINKPKSWKAKSVRELLHFGPDFLRINIMQNELSSIPSKSIAFFDAIFSIPHNTTNSNTIEDFVWADTEEEVKIIFTDGKLGEVAQIYQYGEFIFRIVLIDTNAEMVKNIHYKYKYRIDCYGAFFALERRKMLSVETFLNILIDDDAIDTIKHSISREDICSDISNCTTNSIYRGITGSKKHRKRPSFLKKDPITGEFETIYYGDSSEADRWYARIYNKLKDIIAKKKEKLYFEYFDYEKVTRIETELRSDTCKDYGVTLKNCLNREYLWGVYTQLLNNQFIKWKIVKFIDRELKKKFFVKSLIDRRDSMPIPLNQTEYGSRLLKAALRFEERYNTDVLVFLNTHIPLMRNSLNQITEKSPSKEK